MAAIPVYNIGDIVEVTIGSVQRQGVVKQSWYDESSGSVTDTADNGSSILRCTDEDHGLTDGDTVTLDMVDNAHDGVTTVTIIDADTFDADDITYNSDSDTGTWVKAQWKYEVHTHYDDTVRGKATRLRLVELDITRLILAADSVIAHAESHTDGTDDIQSATNAQKGVATAAHITQIETNTSDISALETSYNRRAKCIDLVDNTSAPPTEVEGDRYILDETGGGVHADWDGAAANDIVEFSSGSWVAITPAEGWIAYTDTEGKDALFVDDGVAAWELRPTIPVNHNDLAGIDGGTYHLTEAQHTQAIILNTTSASAPTVDDDVDGGHSIGSRWYETTTDKEYVCLDNTDGAAAWTETTSSGGGDIVFDEIVSTWAELKTALEVNNSKSVGINADLLADSNIAITDDPVTDGMEDFIICSVKGERFTIDLDNTYQIQMLGATSIYKTARFKDLHFSKLPDGIGAIKYGNVDSPYGYGLVLENISAYEYSGTTYMIWTDGSGNNKVTVKDCNITTDYLGYWQYGTPTSNYLTRILNTVMNNLGVASSTSRYVSAIISNCSFSLDNTTGNGLKPKSCLVSNSIMSVAKFGTGSINNKFTNCTMPGTGQIGNPLPAIFTTPLDFAKNKFSNCTLGATYQDSYVDNFTFRGKSDLTCVQNKTVSKTNANFVYTLADISDMSKHPVGLCSWVQGDQMDVLTKGIADGFSGLTVGDRIYADTSGNITQTSNGTDPIGWAMSDTLAFFDFNVKETAFATMKFDNNSTETPVTTINTEIAVETQVAGSLLRGFTFNAGDNGAITVFADAGGGQVTVTSAAHGLTTGDLVTIQGTTSYNGVFVIANVATDTFEITDTWVANDATGTWHAPSYLECNAAGYYSGSWNFSAGMAGSAGDTVLMTPYVDTVSLDGGRVQRKFGNGDVGSAGGGDIASLAVGDRIWIALQSDGTDNVTISYGAIKVTKI